MSVCRIYRQALLLNFLKKNIRSTWQYLHDKEIG
jgi:hypothetical protein